MQELNTTTGTAIATLPPCERAVVVLDSKQAEKKLRDLIANSSGIIAVIDPAGREEAHRAGMTLKSARVAIEKTGKAAREDAQAFSKAVIAEEKRLVGLVQPEEDRLMNLRNGYDAKLAAEKAERDRIEKQRILIVQSKLNAIRNLPISMANDTAEQIANEIAALRIFTPGEDFAEFKTEAAEAVAGTIETLSLLHSSRAAQEAEAARLAAERAELARQRAEAAEQERVRQEAAQAERNRIAAEQAQRQLELDEERRQLRAQQEALDAERRAIAEQRLAEQAAEDARRKAELHAAEKSERAAAAPEPDAPIETLAPMIEAQQVLAVAPVIAPVFAAVVSNDNADDIFYFREFVGFLRKTLTDDEIRALLEETLKLEAA